MAALPKGNMNVTIKFLNPLTKISGKFFSMEEIAKYSKE